MAKELKNGFQCDKCGSLKVSGRLICDCGSSTYSFSETEKKDVSETEKKDEIELKPCPFCGCTNIHYGMSVTSYGGDLHQGTTKYHYSCRDCKAFGPQDENVEKARILWNSRVGD